MLQVAAESFCGSANIKVPAQAKLSRLQQSRPSRNVKVRDEGHIHFSSVLAD